VHVLQVARVRTPRAIRLRGARERRSAREKERGVTGFDLGNEICDTDPCPLKIDGA
jgi:hypothetical protein